MQRVQLGRTKMMMSRYCLGTMTFGVQTSEADAFEQMDMALAEGINCFDTAELYPVLPISKETQGESERIVGRWKKSRILTDEALVFSKVAGVGSTSTKNGEPIDRKDLIRAIDRSLKNLQTDCIDLYQLHWPNRPHYNFRKIWNFDVDPSDTNEVVDNLVETIETLDEFQKQGKIRAYGVSNDSTWGVMKMLEIASARDLIRCTSAQQEYSLMNRIFEPDFQEVALREDVSLLTYSTLAGGLLTGKYGKDGSDIPAGSRRSIEPEVGGRVGNDMWPILNSYVQLARDSGLDPIHMAYRFALSQNFVGSVIIGATSSDQLRTILNGEYEPLPAEILAEIAQIYRKYPMPL